MKKLLSLIGALTIVTGSSVPVIACESSPHISDKEKANAIKQKIIKTVLTIPNNTASQTVADNTTAIKTALKAENLKLTDPDLAKITFAPTKSGGTFTPGTPLAVTATITVGTAKATKALQVTMEKSAAQQIIDKITNKNITILAGTNPDVTNPATVTALNTALQKANKSLTNADLQKLSYSGSPLVPGTTPTTITVTANDGSKKASTTLQVTMPQTDQQKADAIKEKITNATSIIPNNINSQTVSANTTAIKTALKAQNPGLTADDIAKITFAPTKQGAPFVPGTPLAVTATITVGAAKATVALKVTMASTDKQKAEAIKQKMSDPDLTIPANTKSKTVAANTTAIKTALKSDNPTLTDDDIATMMFSPETSGAEFILGQALPVTATITVGTATATKTLQVTMAQTDQQKAEAIKEKITDPNLTVPLKTNSSTANPVTIKAIKTALKTANQTLTDDVAGGDLKKITFDTVTLTVNTAVKVTATITVGKATATKTLNVTRTVLWTQSKSIPSNAVINSAPVKIDSTYYFGTVGNGLYTSTNGTTWTQSTSIPTGAQIYAAPVKIGNTYYLGTVAKGLYTSLDGATWTQSKSIPTNANIHSAPVKIDNKYYLGTYDKGLYTSPDGTTWTQSTSIPPNAIINAAPVKINNTYYLGTGGKGLYKSTDGATWTQSTNIPSSADIYSAPVIIDNMYYYLGTDKGLYTSTDGTTWTQSTSIPPNAIINAAPVKINNTYYLGTVFKGLYTSTDGTTWTQSKSIPSGAAIYAAPVKINNTYYLSTEGDGLYTSTDGATWTQSTSIPTDVDIYVAPVKINNTYYLGTVGSGFYIGT